MKISYVNSLCVHHDAISNAIRDELGFLANGGYSDVRLFASVCDDPTIAFTRVESLSDIVVHPHFQNSDLVVFHFGIFYALFDLLPLVPVQAKRLVVFHNITPKNLTAPANHWVIDRSFEQLQNIRWADRVVCDSEVNLGVLRAHSIYTDAVVVPLSVHLKLRAPNKKPSFNTGVLRIVFLGRFVRSKGPHELLRAVDHLLQNVSNHMMPALHVDLIGNLAFSDATLVDELHSKIRMLKKRFGKRVTFEVRGNVTDEAKHLVLEQADVFVLPTYHEGFCVPIVEALAAGCRVVAYDNSNVPSICGGLADLVSTGDVVALADTLMALVAELKVASVWKGDGPGSYSDYVTRTLNHLQKFSSTCVERQFLKAINDTRCGARLRRSAK